MSETASRDSTPTANGEGRLLSPSAPQWADVLPRTDHDVYHLPEYVSLDANVSGGTPAAFWYREEGHAFLLPLILRDIPDSDLRDAVSPYGYPGPVSDASHEDTAFWRRACDQMVETLGANGVVATFVRLHPLLPVPLDVLDGAGAVIHHGETVSVDLSLSLEEMWRATRRDHPTTSTAPGGPGSRWCSTTGSGSTSGSPSTTRTCSGWARRSSTSSPASTWLPYTRRSGTGCTWRWRSSTARWWVATRSSSTAE